MVENNHNPIKTTTLNKEFDVNLAITVLRRNFYVPLIIAVFASVACFVYLRYTKPVYQSTAVIQRTSQDEGKRILDIEGFEKEGNLSEDVELLKSTFLLEKSLRNLNLEISYFAEGEILTEERYLSSSYHITLLELKDSSLVGDPIWLADKGDHIDLSFISKGQNKIITVQPNVPINNQYFNLIFKINNKDLFEKNSKNNKLYFVFNNYQNLTSQLHPSLEVFALNPEAQTIQISFKSNNHRLSQNVVSSMITTFFEYDLEKKRQSSASILDFIESQLDTVFIQLKESETAIQLFKDTSKVNDPTLYSTHIMDRINDLQNQLLEVNVELQLFQSVNEVVKKKERIGLFNMIPAITGTAYEALLIGEIEKLNELLIEKEDLAYGVTPEHDQVGIIDSRINSQTDNIVRTLSTITDQLRFKRNMIIEQISDVKGNLYGVPAQEMELNRLNRMFNLNEKYYTLLIEKKTQYAISKAGFTMDNMVLQAPTDAVLISPNRGFIYTFSIVLTILFSLIYLLIKYITFNDINEVDELKKLLPSSVGFLGIVPKVVMDDKNSALIVHLRAKSALAESYRLMRSNLQFILKPDQSSVIAISSSVSGEGKTFVAVNLGGIIAMTGKKVLVLDLDLRKPKIHLAFKAENKDGMSSILVKAINWKDCINKSDIEGLDFITAGPIPPNPSELIIGEFLKTLISELKDEYDIVIIDNPPVGIVSDGISVLNNADCPIYVFRSNYSKRFYAQRVRELVENKQVSKLFVVLNGFEVGKRGYGYGYGSGYSDYYSDEIKPKKLWQFWKK